jgi:hypothetical protein
MKRPVCVYVCVLEVCVRRIVMDFIENTGRSHFAPGMLS